VEETFEKGTQWQKEMLQNLQTGEAFDPSRTLQTP
jgi:hypothetical protein